MADAPKHHHMGSQRGWHSTKLHQALITEALITGVYLYAHAPDSNFAVYCTALLAAAGIYAGASVVEKFKTPPAPSAGAP